MPGKPSQIPSAVQGLEPGDEFFLWNEEAICRYVVLENAEDDDGAPGVNCALVDNIPACVGASECPHGAVECDGCDIMFLTFEEMVYGVENIEGYCTAKELE